MPLTSKPGEGRLIASASQCPLCSGSVLQRSRRPAHDVATPLTISLIECTHCGLAWQFPHARSTQQSAEYFASNYQDARSGSYFDKSARTTIARLQVGFIDRLRPERGRLLDIGAGDGTFVSEAAAAGWDCLGLDPACTSPRDQALAGGGNVRLLATPLDEVNEGKFDVITLWDVIEHVEDPVAVISSALARLSNTGVLVVETGNYQSTDRIEGGDSWWCYQADHRWYFSPPTLARVLAAAGLPWVTLSGEVFRPRWKGDASYAGPSRWRTAKALLRAPHRGVSVVRRHRLLDHAGTAWRAWAGLGIFTLAAGRNPHSNIGDRLLRMDLGSDESKAGAAGHQSATPAALR